jgi:acyl-CoA reductase-like NAD-dependent aldehyde dehydrogenase
MIRERMQRIFINGEWIDASAPSSAAIANPATGKPLGVVAECDRADVDRAVGAARGALAEWGGLSADDRASLLAAVAERLRARRGDLVPASSREAGKPLCEAADCLEGAARIFERSAAVAARGPGPTPAVAAAIASCRFPLVDLALTVAIAAGHTVVVKPARETSISSLELLGACGVLPRGVLNAVTGGAATGRALLAHPDVGRASFSGSRETARRIVPRDKPMDILACARRDFIVCRGADLERAVPSIAWERLTNGGQGCGSAHHLYVERAIAAEFAERMHQCIGFLDVDDPVKLPTDLGPLISLDAAKRVEDQVGRTLRAGARIVLGGRRFRPSGLAGHFFQPTLLTDVRPGSEPTVEDIAGPVITITPVAGLSEALQLVQTSGRGGAAIYGTLGSIADALEALESGTFRINDPDDPAEAGSPAPGLPPGLRDLVNGAASSGIDARPSPKRIEAAESVSIKPWWFPYLERNRRSR